jgi:protein TonB
VVAAPAPPAIFTYVEQMPAPSYDLPSYFAKNIHYPDAARENNITGRVIVKFVVDEEGAISDIQVIRGIGGGCDEEAKRVIAAMPKWKPGKQNGKPVKVYFTQPITFNLE